jgi:hypothetical protein
MLLYTLAAVGANGPTELSVEGVPAVTMKEFDWRPTLKEGERTYKRARHLFDEFLDQIALNTNNTNGKGEKNYFSTSYIYIRASKSLTLCVLKQLSCLKAYRYILS